MSQQDVPPDPSHEGEKKVIRHWFYNLPGERQHEITKPVFDAEHPSTKDKIAARTKYEHDTGDRLK